MLTHHLKDAFPKKRIQIKQHWALKLDGDDRAEINIAHHGPATGIRHWLKGNVLQLYTLSLMMRRVSAGKVPPLAVFRAHHHELLYRPVIYQTEKQIWETRAWITPPFCYISGHGQQVMQSPDVMSVGMIAVEFVNRRIHDWHHWLHTIDLAQGEVI